MRKLFFMLLVCGVFFACDDDTREDAPELPIKNLEFPTEEVFRSGKKVTIRGKGFTSLDKIFLRSAKVKSALSDRILVTDIQVTETSLTFTLPAEITGKYEVILSQNENEYVLGVLTIEQRETEYYAFCYGEDVNELARLDLENEQLIWTGVRIPDYKGNGRGEVIDKLNNEFIAFVPYPATIYKGDMETKAVKTLVLEKNDENRNFNDIIKTSDNQYYAFCYDKDKCELARLDPENEQLVWTGVKIPGYEGNSRGEAIDEVSNDFIAFVPYPATIYKVNMETKVVKTIILEKNGENRNFNDIIKTSDNQYYAFCYDKDKCELARLDPENEQLVWTGIKIPGYERNSRGELIDEEANEFIAFVTYPATVYKVNMETKVVKTIVLEKNNEKRNFRGIIKK